MNKIEKAIHETNIYFEGLKRQKLTLVAEINAVEQVLDMLKNIQNNKSIPNETFKN